MCDIFEYMYARCLEEFTVYAENVRVYVRVYVNMCVCTCMCAHIHA